MPAGAARSPACSRRRSPRWKSSAPTARRIAAAIGPMIRQPNYEVGPEFVARFTAADAANARFFAAAARAGHAMFDLPGFIARASATRRHRRDRGPRALHLCRPGALLQLPPHHPPRRAGLRPPRQRHRARRLSAGTVRRFRRCARWTRRRTGALRRPSSRDDTNSRAAGVVDGVASESARRRRAACASVVCAWRRRARCCCGRAAHRQRPAVHASP